MQSGFGTGRGEEWQQPYGKQRGRSPTIMTGSILEMPWDLGVFPERFMEVFEAIARVAFDSRQDVRHVMPLRIVRRGNSDSLSRLITGLAHRIQCMGSQATAQALYGSKQHFRRTLGRGSVLSSPWKDLTRHTDNSSMCLCLGAWTVAWHFHIQRGHAAPSGSRLPSARRGTHFSLAVFLSARNSLRAPAMCNNPESFLRQRYDASRVTRLWRDTRPRQ